MMTFFVGLLIFSAGIGTVLVAWQIKNKLADNFAPGVFGGW